MGTGGGGKRREFVEGRRNVTVESPRHGRWRHACGSGDAALGETQAEKLDSEVFYNPLGG